MCKVCKRCTEISALRITPALTTNPFFHLPSIESIYLHAFSVCPTQLICHICNSLHGVDDSLPSVSQSSFFFTAPLPLILSQPSGLPATAPPVHQHRGQEGGIYADIWTVIPTIHAACQFTTGSSLQQAHTHTASKARHTPAVWPGN